MNLSNNLRYAIHNFFNCYKCQCQEIIRNVESVTTDYVRNGYQIQTECLKCHENRVRIVTEEMAIKLIEYGARYADMKIPDPIEQQLPWTDLKEAEWQLIEKEMIE